MKQLGVTQTELAKRMKVSRPYVTKVLTHDVNFSFKTAIKLASALKMDFFPDLIPQDEEEEPLSEAQNRQIPHPDNSITQ